MRLDYKEVKPHLSEMPYIREDVYTIKATGSYQGDKAALFEEAKIKGSFADHGDYVAHHVSYDPDVHSQASHARGVKDYRAAHNGEGYKNTRFFIGN
jgi:hypothetical protein